MTVSVVFFISRSVPFPSFAVVHVCEGSRPGWSWVAIGPLRECEDCSRVCVLLFARGVHRSVLRPIVLFAMRRVAELTPPGPVRAMVKRLYWRDHMTMLYPLPPHLDVALGPLSVEGAKRQWEFRAAKWKRQRIVFSLAYAMLEGDP